MSKHTAGPWVLLERAAGTFEVWPYTDDDCCSIAIVHADDEEDGANARLIAAASRMYAELVAMVGKAYTEALIDGEV